METLALIGILVTGFSALWWRSGRMEARINGALKEWQSLKARCPLCTVDPKEKT